MTQHNVQDELRRRENITKHMPDIGMCQLKECNKELKNEEGTQRETEKRERQTDKTHAHTQETDKQTKEEEKKKKKRDKKMEKEERIQDLP